MEMPQSDASSLKPDTRIVESSTPSAEMPAFRVAELERWFRTLTPRQQIWIRSAVYDGQDDLAIANELKTSYENVSDFVRARKWRDRILADAEDRKRDAALLNTWRSAVSVKAQDVSLGALALAGDAVTLKDAKGLANAARGAASLVSLVRQAEGMDSKDAGAAQSVNISVFYIPSPAKKVDAAPINVTPEPAAVGEGDLF